MQQKVLVVSSTGTDFSDHSERVNAEFAKLGSGWRILPGAAITTGFSSDGVVKGIDRMIPVVTLITTITAQKGR